LISESILIATGRMTAAVIVTPTGKHKVLPYHTTVFPSTI
jgi:hypothetical protein